MMWKHVGEENLLPGLINSRFFCEKWKIKIFLFFFLFKRTKSQNRKQLRSDWTNFQTTSEKKGKIKMYACFHLQLNCYKNNYRRISIFILKQNKRFQEKKNIFLFGKFFTQTLWKKSLSFTQSKRDLETFFFLTRPNMFVLFSCHFFPSASLEK